MGYALRNIAALRGWAAKCKPANRERWVKALKELEDRGREAGPPARRSAEVEWSETE